MEKGYTFEQMWLDLKNGFAESCDVYYWTIGRDNLGIEKIASYSKEFGLNYKIDKNGFHVSVQDLMKSKETIITYVKIVEGSKTHIYYLKSTKK